MRISDWSSDVCSSDLAEDEIVVYGRSVSTSTLDIPQTVNVLSESLIEETASARLGDALRFVPGASRDGSDLDAFGDQYMVRGFGVSQTVNEIGRASCRERVCQYV